MQKTLMIGLALVTGMVCSCQQQQQQTDPPVITIKAKK